MKINNIELTQEEMTHGLELDRIYEVYGHEDTLLNIVRSMQETMTSTDVERINALIKPGDVEKINLTRFTPSFRLAYESFKKVFTKRASEGSVNVLKHLKEVSDDDKFFICIEGWRNNLVDQVVQLKANVNFRVDNQPCEVKFFL